MAIADQYPDMIKGMIREARGESGRLFNAGATIQIHMLGAPRFVVVDHRVPYNSDGTEPAFYKINTETYAAWPLLIHKAYAKAHGNYFHIKDGLIQHGIQDLIGAPSRLIFEEKGYAKTEEFAA